MRASLVKLGLSMAAISGPAGTIVACFCRRLKRGRMRKKNDCDAMQTAGSRRLEGRVQHVVKCWSDRHDMRKSAGCRADHVGRCMHAE
jgi:hypothetical protein